MRYDLANVKGKISKSCFDISCLPFTLTLISPLLHCFDISPFTLTRDLPLFFSDPHCRTEFRDPHCRTEFQGSETSLSGQWLPATGGDGSWSARTGSGLILMSGVEGPVADDGASAFPAILLWLAGGLLWEVTVAGRSAAGAGPGRGRVALRVRRRNLSSRLVRRGGVGRHAGHGTEAKTAFIATVKRLVLRSFARFSFRV